MFLFKPVEDGDDADQNALSRMGIFFRILISEQVDLWGKMAEVALCIWLHQPARTFGWFPMTMLVIMVKRDNAQRMFQPANENRR